MKHRQASWLLGLAVLALLPTLARADDSDVVTLGRPTRPPILTLDPFHGSVGVTGFYSSLNSKAGTQSSTGTNLVLQETLNLNTKGTVVSRNLMEWTASANVWVQELESASGGSSQNQLGVFDTYDFHTNILKNTEFPITAYAQQSETFTDRAFAALVRTTSTTYGGSVRYASPSLPSSLTYGHTTITQSDLGGATQYSTDADNVSAETSFQPLDRQHVSLNYAYNRTAQTNPGTLNTNSETQSGSIGHDWSFDADGHYTLSQGVSISQQTGSTPASSLGVSESLRAVFSETLQGSVDYRFLQQQNTFSPNNGFGITPLNSYSSDMSSNYFNASLSHRLFESLVTTANVGATTTDTSYTGSQNSSSSTRSYFGSLGTNYSKKVYMGRLGASVGINYNQSQNSSVTQPQQVLNEAQVFTDPEPIILTKVGVDPNSIAVFDSTHSRQFVRNQDYTVRKVGNAIQVQRVLGGAIDPIESVRLNYLVDPLPGYTADTTSFNAGANYLFDEGVLKGLNLYTRYAQSDQTITPAATGILPDSTRDILFGAEYHIWKLTLTAEEQNHQSTLAAYDAQRFRARYLDHLGDRTTLTLDLSQTFNEYPTASTNTAVTTVGGQLTYRITRDLTAELAAQWRNQEDTLLGNTMGLEESGKITWKVRQTNMFMMIRHTSLETGGANSESFFFQFGIFRNF